MIFRQSLNRPDLEWWAAQGNKQAQHQLSGLFRHEGKNDWADFYQGKAEGTNPHFTLESFLEERKAA